MTSADKNHSTKASRESEVHPEINDLLLLIFANENSSNDRDNSPLILHVAECLQCQKRLTVLTFLKQSHHTIKDTTVSEAQQMLVVDYLRRGFSISRKKLLRQKIQDEPSSLKEMLHYASHSEAMRLNIKGDMATQEKNADGGNIKVEKTRTRFHPLAMISRLLLTLKLPFKWSFAFNFSTVYSMFVSLLFIGLLLVVLSNKLNSTDIDASKNLSKSENNTHIELEFISNGLNNSSSIYAVDKGESPYLEEGRQKGKVKIHLNEKNNLHVGWPISSNASFYTLSFYPVDNPKKIAELSVSTMGDFVELDVKNFEPGKRYQWVFSYQTLDEKIFRAQGKFILNTASHGR